MKVEGINLTSMVATLHSIVDCQLLKLQKVDEGTCFNDIMSKACQYATNDVKVANDLKHVIVKATQGSV